MATKKATTETKPEYLSGDQRQLLRNCLSTGLAQVLMAQPPGSQIEVCRMALELHDKLKEDDGGDP